MKKLIQYTQSGYEYWILNPKIKQVMEFIIGMIIGILLVPISDYIEGNINNKGA